MNDSAEILLSSDKSRIYEYFKCFEIILQYVLIQLNPLSL